MGQGSPVLEKVLREIEVKFEADNPRKPGYNFIMDIVKRVVIAEGFIASIMKPVAYNLISPDKQQALFADGWSQNLFADGAPFGLNQYWRSTKNDRAPSIANPSIHQVAFFLSV